MARTELPASHADLLDRPLYAHLATLGPDGAPQSSTMWFVRDGDVLRFTHTTTRQKYRNLLADPRVALSIHDPENPYRSLEVRGVVESIEPDDEDASFYRSLMTRYGTSYDPPDAPVRVILTMRPTAFVPH
ncbi:PPOX class F420-dependent enzyme [Cellulomonas chitinilytica]|uniref:PPOX class F420-dependent enzyme n=1 Tax=Cellulomonas chitinilytica TaxID=398759 RepID=A0A919U274_9CELL|nr:PPOX class F420-dependent oxidoreductase [Cellulomonas chitinilytica]GIG20844.1 PPOX class F420-dependent enzyme [Cellulomonas chitinilytica]